MRLFSYTAANEMGIGVETKKGCYRLNRAFDIYQKAKGIQQPVSISFLQVLVEMGYCSKELINQVLEESWVQSKYSQLQLEPNFQYELPIARPSKIIGLGRNYKAHAKELDHDVPEEPLFFAKAPSSLIPHEADIVIPSWLDGRVDHEAELAVIIGKTAKNVREEEAASFIAGYSILNDVTARAMQKEDQNLNMPWFRSKSIDTFCPFGPYIVPADAIQNPHALEIVLTVNGKQKQRAKTSSMIFQITEVIAHLSRFMTLHPGDIIATGTPAGVSPIADGDVVEISITHLGTLRNRVVKQT